MVCYTDATDECLSSTVAGLTWDLIMLVLILYNVFAVPVSIVRCLLVPEAAGRWLALELILNHVCVAVL